MSNATAQEQYLLELINETRINPMANAARYISSYDNLSSPDLQIQQAFDQFGVGGSVLRAAYEGLTPVAPIAWNNSLAQMASAHNQSMIKFDTQSHQTPEEGTLGQRATAAGYLWQSLAENVYSYAYSVIYAHAGFMVDWGTGPSGMQDPAKHRIAIMNPSYRELGISYIAESNSATSVGPNVVTQEFGARSNIYFVTGVAYSDNDQNQFYSVGEGLAGLSVTIGAKSDTSGTAGGYSVEAARGAPITISISGGGLAGALTVTTTIAQNLKLDVVNGSTLLTSGSIAVEGPVSTIRAIGLAGVELAAGAGSQAIRATAQNDTLKGGQGNDTLYGFAGNDTLHGDLGSDTAVFKGLRSAYTITQGSVGVFQIAGPDGTDSLHDIEIAKFDDQAVQLIAVTSNVGVGRLYLEPWKPNLRACSWRKSDTNLWLEPS